MSVPLIFLLIVMAGIGIGVARRFGPVQWIWLLFGLAMVLLIMWVLMLVLVVGPGMRRMGPPGG
jgi:hypothetical protein